MDLTNATLRRFNGTQIAQADFSNTTDADQDTAKLGVQEAIDRINAINFAWPFNFSRQTITCVAGQSEYDVATNTKFINWHTLLLKKDDTLGVAEKYLPLVEFSDYVKRYAPKDGNATSSDYTVPSFVYRTPDNKIGVSPKPDQAYTIEYVAYSYPTILSAATDTTEIPDAFKHVIIMGASIPMLVRRGNVEQSEQLDIKFTQAIKEMRSILANDYFEVKDTRTGRMHSGKYSSSGRF